MRRPDYLTSLADLRILADCTTNELKSASKLVTAIEFGAGEVILRQDTFGREFLIVASGQLGIERTDGDLTKVLGVAETGDVVGEMALLHRELRTATVTTLVPTRIYVGSTREFFTLLDALPTVARRIMSIADERQRTNLAA